MSETMTIARPYAKAAFELAQAGGELKTWSEMLAFASAVVTDERIAALTHDPRVGHARLAGLLLEICGKRLTKEGANFIRLLIDNRRLAVLPEVLQQFEQLRAEAEARVDAEVISAAPLEPEQMQLLAKALQRKLGREVHLTPRIDPALIGGAIVRAGDLVIDGSVRAQLTALSSHLHH